jgi:hypothetical protein
MAGNRQLSFKPLGHRFVGGAVRQRSALRGPRGQHSGREGIDLLELDGKN